MKWVRAVITPSHLDDVVDALCAIGVTRLTMTEVQCCGEPAHDADAHENDEASEYRHAFVPRLQIEAALPDEGLAKVIAALDRSIRTGMFGEGTISVWTLERAVRIRTGERGETAL